MLNIIYQDNSLIAINKPTGLLVHRSMIDRHETQFALQMLRDQIGQRVYPVHRLDKPTSGVLLFALSSESARKMAGSFSTHKTAKTYLAIVRGYTQECGLIDYPLKEALDRMTDSKATQDKAAQPALTRYQRIATLELPFAVGRHSTARYSLLEIKPETGRKHQIRRHMKHIFHPIAGDTTHGDGKHNLLYRDRFNCHRLLLHAKSLCFDHPDSGDPVMIDAPLDETFSRVTDMFR